MRYEFDVEGSKVVLRKVEGTAEVAEFVVRWNDRILVKTDQGPEVLCETCEYVACYHCGDCACDKDAKEKGEKPKGDPCGVCDERMANRER